MDSKRHEAQARAAEARIAAALAAEARAAEARRAKAAQLAARPVETRVPVDHDVVPWLRQLGFNAREARSAAALCSGLADAPLEERVRAALRYFHPRGHVSVGVG